MPMKPFCITSRLFIGANLAYPWRVPVALPTQRRCMAHLLVQPHKIFEDSFPQPSPPKLPVPLPPAPIITHVNQPHWEESSRNLIQDSFPHPPPPKLPVASPSVSITTQVGTAHWKESPRSLMYILNRLQDALRVHHKRRIRWPADSNLLSMSPQEHLLALLEPVAAIFNQLHSKDWDAKVLDETPMQCVALNLGKDVLAAKFHIEAEIWWPICLPVVIALEDEILDPLGNVTKNTERHLRLLTLANISPQAIVVTNFRDIVAFFPPTGSSSSHFNQPAYSFRKLSTTRPVTALRALCAALIYNSWHFNSFIDVPCYDVLTSKDPDLALPEGPCQDPERPLQADDELVRTHQHFSDFDQVTLMRDERRALQFFRWHEFVKANNSRVVVGPGDIVSATRAGFVPDNMKPLYPFEWPMLPPDTLEHLRPIQRESPIQRMGLAQKFDACRDFQLQITDVIAKGTDIYSYATVYKCRLTSIDGRPIPTSETLCLKLFDDRFYALRHSEQEDEDDDDEPQDKPLHQWFEDFRLAEDAALTEHFAYEKLRPVQGSIVPWYHGIYEFTLPNQLSLCGILMEYIPGANPGSKSLTKNMTPEQQVSIIQSCRHATRVLDAADIARIGWSVGKIMIHRNPETHLEHCVLIDFADTGMTWSEERPIPLYNSYECQRLLMYNTWFERKLVIDNMGPPDEWDPHYLLSESPTGELSPIRAKSPFTYILSA